MDFITSLPPSQGKTLFWWLFAGCQNMLISYLRAILIRQQLWLSNFQSHIQATWSP